MSTRSEFDLLIMTDGRRECFLRTFLSAIARLPGPWRIWIHDDSGDPTYRSFLRDVCEPYPQVFIFGPAAGRSGFGGAIDSAWQRLRFDSDSPFIFHLEDDFTFNRRVELNQMMDVLDHHPSIVQVALRRQPWNDAERAAGGVVEVNPLAFIDRSCFCYGPGGRGWHAEKHWLEHRQFFTTNPSLYRRTLLDRGWPTVDRSEGVFTHHLLEDPDVRFAYWGERGDGPWVHHIGDERVGTGY